MTSSLQRLARAALTLAVLGWFTVLTPSTTLASNNTGVLTAYQLKQLLKDAQGDLPGKEGAYRFSDLQMEPGRALIRYQVGEKGTLDVVLVPLQSTEQAFKKSASFKIFYPAHPSHQVVSKEVLMEALNAIVRRIQKADPGRLKLPDPESLKPSPTPDETRQSSWQGGTPNRKAGNTNHLRFGFVLLFLCLVLLPVLVKRAWGVIAELQKQIRFSLLGTIAVGSLLRLFIIPHIVVTMYMGYLLTEQAATLQETFRYGVGAQVLWNALFHVAPVDHASLIGLNAVLGSLNLLLWAAILHRAGLKPIGVLFATILMAFLPMILWSDGSDSLTIVVLFWNLGAVLFAQEFLRGKRMLDLWGALLWLGMAAHTRPEQAIFGPLLVLTVLASQEGPERLLERLKAPLQAWLIAGAGYLVIIWPQLVHAMNRRARLIELDSWPHELWDVLPDLPRLLQTENALVNANMTPQLLLPLALVSLLIARSWPARRFRLSILGLGLVWMIFYYIDLSSASLPRLHIVLAIPCCIAAADLLSDLWDWRPEKALWAGRALVAAAFLVLALQAPQTARWLWQDTNEWQEDRMYREAVALIPDEPYQLVHYGYGDPEAICVKNAAGQEECRASHTHEHHPDYLVEPPQGQARVFGANDFTARGALDQPTYFYLGMRCYSQLRAVDAPAPKQYFAPACAKILKTFELETILERDLPNHGDFGLHYYSQEKSFKLGLYRLTSRR